MTTSPAGVPPNVPWSDRGEAMAEAPPSPRSQRDLELLRALARRIDPHDAGAHNNLGVVFYNKGLYDDAIRHFERALDLDPRMQVAERNLQICYFGTGHLEKLATGLQQRLSRNPQDAAARDELARTLFNSGDYHGASEQLRELLALRPDDAALYQRLARAEQRRGGLEAALDTLRRAEALEPRNARVQFMIGETLYQRGLSVDATAPLERAIELDPGLADAYHLLAFVYGDRGDTELATRMAERAAELNPSYGRAEAGLSLDSYSTARYQELIGGQTAQAPGIAEGGELAHYNLGLAFRQKALYDEALREFRLAQERGEDTFLVHQAQAEMLLLRGGSGEALELYVQLIEQEPSSPKLWNELGVARHQAGELAEAEEAYRRSLEIDPHYALAWNNLGVVRHYRQRADAEEAFLAAVREGRALADVWRNWALMLHRLERRPESAAAYEKALAADPQSAQARTGLGILFMEMGRPEEARAQLLRAVELDPSLAEARYNLAFAQSALGDYQAALRETRLALELNPYIPTPRFRLLIDLHFEPAGVFAPELDAGTQLNAADSVPSFSFDPGALERVFDGAAPHQIRAEPQPGEDLLEAAREALERGLFEQASAAVQRAGVLGASRMEVLLLQGEIFLRRGLSGEAVERFDAVLAEIARSGSADHDDTLRRALHGAARSLLDLGRMAQAVEAAERLCALAPNDVEALRTLGDALSRVQDYGRAVILLEQARVQAPGDGHLLTQLGTAYAAAGDLERAESVLRRAIEADSLAVAARTMLARVLARSRREEEAAAQYEDALRLLPSYGEAAFGLAELHENEGRLRPAIHVMVDLLNLDPYRSDALLRLSELLVRAGQTRQARFALERVLRLDPHQEQARALRARITADEG
jgi:cellulose synthase operon protein C